MGLSAAGLLALLPEGSIPALAQGETEVAFTDLPPNFDPATPTATLRILDIRNIDGLLTPKDKFYAIQHHNRPEVDGNAYRLKVSGLVNKPAEFSLNDLKAMPATEIVAGYECSGNSPRLVQGLVSNGKWKGVRLSTLLERLGVNADAREVVFFGTDRAMQDIVFRQDTYKLEQQFGRSMTLENAMKPEPLVAYSLNDEPLTREQGFPVRLIVPGWYGVANVKWLAEIHLQEDRYVGNYQARWYRNLKGEGDSEDPAKLQWVETEVTRQQLKSVIARVTKKNGAYEVLGFVLNDGTPLTSVEVQVDGGLWQSAKLDPANTKYSWKLFTYRWEGATPGEHTLVSRVTDAKSRVQPTAGQLANKKTFLQDNGQYPRKVKIG
ncbi:MAG: molybdopterin-dependent oxidoreductase [Bryobacteraceae bacterium]